MNNLLNVTDCDRTGEMTIDENHTPKELRDKGLYD